MDRPLVAPLRDEREMPVTVVSDGTKGQELAERLLEGVVNEPMRAATKLLGAHSDGYWLRRLTDDQELAALVDEPLIDLSGRCPTLDWDGVGHLLKTPGWSQGASRSQAAVLEFAASLVSRCPVQLGKVTHAVDDGEFQLLLAAMEEASYGDPR
ncbi:MULTISPECIES: hypothetical protein [Streptomyces]|uniref:hypothetical protein n=1 Tax=Streptomyces TaxID=1883 RepID=UPI0013185FE7|nr:MULTISPECIES: hypothetical protein [Streptomyces]QGZ47277.1 hypothetical protein GPZ77_01610 [Streptomyces sp. QHH-9511]